MDEFFSSLLRIPEWLGFWLGFAAFVILWLRFRNELRGERHHTFLYLHEHLAINEYSVARHRVRTELYKIEYSTWSEHDREMANRVCASYDQAGILITRKVVTQMDAQIFLQSSWGESICDQYEALKDFLNDWQTPWKRGNEFFVHFGKLYEMARKHHRTILRIVSGGQTGADRAALDVAIALGLPYGGWVPRGGLAEDHKEAPGILTNYPHMREADTVDPSDRTRLNVRDSSATLVLVQGVNFTSPGTALTIAEATKLGRPCLTVNVSDPDAVLRIREWLRGTRFRHVLNVAGPRESEAPGLQNEAKRVLGAVLASPLA